MKSIMESSFNSYFKREMLFSLASQLGVMVQPDVLEINRLLLTRSEHGSCVADLCKSQIKSQLDTCCVYNRSLLIILNSMWHLILVRTFARLVPTPVSYNAGILCLADLSLYFKRTFENDLRLRWRLVLHTRRGVRPVKVQTIGLLCCTAALTDGTYADVSDQMIQ